MRENGKSFAVKEEIINYVASGKKFAYVRRTKSYLSRAKVSQTFDDVEQICLEKLNSRIYYHAERGFYIIDENGKEKNVGYAFNIEENMKYKGTPWVGIRIIMFDEFMDYTYFNDEKTRYINLLSTITRDANTKGEKCVIYLLANTITKYCPYLELYGFNINKMRPGEFAEVSHLNGVRATLEYTKIKVSIDGVQPNNPYVGFDDNETVKMILYGEWETRKYDTKFIDDIGWNCSNRHLIPLYVTANGYIFELSIKVDGVPVAFVRKLNTQQGKVRKGIKYNLTLDKSVILTNNKIVPMLCCANKLIDEGTRKIMTMFDLCVQTGRILFDNLHTGTDFMQAYENIKRRG